MSWRYQPVYILHADDPDFRIYSLCECFFDKDDRLRSWTTTPAVSSQGNSIDDLSGALSRMLAAAWKWKHVPYDSLKVGMTFKRTGVDVEKIITAMEAARTA